MVFLDIKEYRAYLSSSFFVVFEEPFLPKSGIFMKIINKYSENKYLFVFAMSFNSVNLATVSGLYARLSSDNYRHQTLLSRPYPCSTASCFTLVRFGTPDHYCSSLQCCSYFNMAWIPNSFDKIYVRFQLDDDTLVWWPAIVLDLTYAQRDSNVAKASLLLFFEKKYNHEAEQAWMDIIDKDTIATRGSEIEEHGCQHTAWCDEVTYESFAVSNDHDGKVKEEDAMFTSILSLESPTTVRRSKRMKSMRADNEMCTNNTHCATHEHLPSTRTNMETNRGSDLSAFQSVQKQVLDLQRRLVSHERKIQEHTISHIESHMQRRLFSLRMHLRHEIFVVSQAPLRAPKISQQSDFEKIMRRGSLEISCPCDSELFSFLVNDIVESDIFRTDSVLFSPSFADIRNPPQGMHDARVLFRDGKDLLKWLGVRDELDRRNVMWKMSCTAKLKAMRVMGGSQWDADDSSHHMALFPGVSCKKMGIMSVGDQRTGSTAGFTNDDGDHERKEYLEDCLYRENTTWNIPAEKFISPLRRAKLNPLFPSSVHRVHEYASFAVRWNRSDEVSRSKWSPDANLTGDITIGIVTVELPVVHYFGSRTCADVERLSRHWLTM